MADITLYPEARKKSTNVEKILSLPFIYGMVVSLIFFDICATLYHQIAFRLYHIPLLQRSDYIFLDRDKLSKLTWLQKINCIYCEYANGLMAFGVAIAAQTEKYWCPIKHEEKMALEVQPHQKEFFEREQYI